MGTSQSRQDPITDSDTDSDYDEDQYDDVLRNSNLSRPPPSSSSGPSDSSSLDIEQKLSALKLKYSSPATTPQIKNPVKLYRHIGGNTPKAKWIISDKLTSYKFVKTSRDDDGIDDYDDGEESDEEGKSFWYLGVGSKVKSVVEPDLRMKMFGEDKLRVEFAGNNGVWALEFFTAEDYKKFVARFQDCLFENVYNVKASDESRIERYKGFAAWAKPETADDSMWEEYAQEEQEDYEKLNTDLSEEFEEVANGGVQSLALGALENSFLVNASGVQVYRNMERGIHGKGVCVRFDNGQTTTPNKALLMRAETNMMLMSPSQQGKPHSSGVKQLDIESGKIVTEWRFEKDGAEITMRDIINDTKGSQLDPSESTFLGLDDNRLCQWDMRDKRGIVQTTGPAVLEWNQGHQFCRGTKFTCFASSGDGSVVVGSDDGKIRLYSEPKSSGEGRSTLGMAKTTFPGLGSSVTNVDVSFDGKWILGTADTYLVLICTLFTDKDGRMKTGFSGRMGKKMPAPRLLKLAPLDSHLAGKDNKFHGGHFSWVTESGRQERHIVATVGRFSVIWELEKVKNSGHECYRNQQGLKSCYCYKILLKDESIVESRFMHDGLSFSGNNKSQEAAPLVVATPQKVSSINLSGRRLSSV